MADAVTDELKDFDESRPEAGFGPRGRRLWDAVHEVGPLTPTETVLLEEACRSADRLERLDELLRGRDSTWLELVPDAQDGTVVTVMIGNVLTEARQQQTTMKGLLAELRMSRAARAVPATPGSQPAPTATGEVKPGVASVTSLAAHVAARHTAG